MTATNRILAMFRDSRAAASYSANRTSNTDNGRGVVVTPGTSGGVSDVILMLVLVVVVLRAAAVR